MEAIPLPAGRGKRSFLKWGEGDVFPTPKKVTVARAAPLATRTARREKIGTFGWHAMGRRPRKGKEEEEEEKKENQALGCSFERRMQRSELTLQAMPSKGLLGLGLVPRKRWKRRRPMEASIKHQMKHENISFHVSAPVA